MDEAERRRRSNPVGLVGNGCARHCLEDVRRGFNWAAETSPQIHAQALDRGIRGAFREQDEEILMYLVTEANAPLEEINPYKLVTISSLPLWEAALKRGWDINQRTKSHGDSNLVHWLLHHGATVDDGEKDTVKCPPLLQSAAERATVPLYKLFQELGAPHGPRELHLAVKRASGPFPYIEMVRYLVDELGLDVNQLDGDEYFGSSDTGMFFGPPLYWAIEGSGGGEEVVRFLLERGADPYLNGDAIEKAESRGNQGVVAILQEWKEGKIAVQRKD